MSVERKSSLWRFDKTVAGVRFQSRAIYTTKREAELAQAEAVSEYLRTGQILTLPPVGLSASETVEELFFRWCQWLSQHRTANVAYNMERLLLKALNLRADLADLPARSLNTHQAEEWAECLAVEQREAGHRGHYVNDFIRHAQTAYNAPWGRRRAEREYPRNPCGPTWTVSRWSAGPNTCQAQPRSPRSGWRPRAISGCTSTCWPRRARARERR